MQSARRYLPNLPSRAASQWSVVHGGVVAQISTELVEFCWVRSHGEELVIGLCDWIKVKVLGYLPQRFKT